MPFSVTLVTLFPEMAKAITDFGVTRRAVENGQLQLETVNPRDFTEDRHRTVDDRPFGGGPGMVMKVEPLAKALQAARAANPAATVIYLSPSGAAADPGESRSAGGGAGTDSARRSLRRGR